MKNSYRDLTKSLEMKRLIIFGFGGYFTEFACGYREILEKVECILDNNYEKAGVVNLGEMRVQIIPPQMISKYDISRYVVLFCSRYTTEMKEQLDNYIGGAYEYYIYPFFTLDQPMGEKNFLSRVIVPTIGMMEAYNILEEALCFTGCSSKEVFWQELVDKKLLLVPRLVVVLTERCTLRCRECDNLMPRFKAPKNLDVRKILDSLRKIIDAVDVLPFCELIGGEPFLADGLGQVLDYLLREDKVLRVEITTNGTIFPKQGDISLLRNRKVTVRVSDYSNIVDQSRFVMYMKETGIRLEIIHGGEWIANGSVEKRGRDIDKLMLQYDRCYSGKVCKTLWEDRLFACARAASLAKLKYTDDGQSLNIEDSTDLREGILRFLCIPLITACNYCDIESGAGCAVSAAEQLR